LGSQANCYVLIIESEDFAGRQRLACRGFNVRRQQDGMILRAISTAVNVKFLALPCPFAPPFSTGCGKTLSALAMPASAAKAAIGSAALTARLEAAPFQNRAAV
jgi:hypothetical protein